MSNNTEKTGKKRKKRGRRVIEPDISPVTFLAAGILWLLMMPNNLAWRIKGETDGKSANFAPVLSKQECGKVHKIYTSELKVKKTEKKEPVNSKTPQWV